jgi:hypothetical protein
MLTTSLDCINRIDFLDRKRATLIGVNERRKRVELAFLSRARLRVPQLFDAPKRSLMRCRIHNGFNHGSHLIGIDAVSYRLGAAGSEA